LLIQPTARKSRILDGSKTKISSFGMHPNTIWRKRYLWNISATYLLHLLVLSERLLNMKKNW
jgi:hypothetical protein